jgi:hypothetical protein
MHSVLLSLVLEFIDIDDPEGESLVDVTSVEFGLIEKLVLGLLCVVCLNSSHHVSWNDSLVEVLAQ